MTAVTITLDFDPVVMCFAITGTIAVLFGLKWWKANK